MYSSTSTNVAIVCGPKPIGKWNVKRNQRDVKKIEDRYIIPAEGMVGVREKECLAASTGRKNEMYEAISW